MEFYKYQGAGNDFLIADNRNRGYALSAEKISALCDRHYGIGADGLMLLESSDCCDFRMVYYNSDGSGGMMCGNGGRCIVAFAARLGFSSFRFEAADGLHQAYMADDHTVRLKMTDVQNIRKEDGNSYFLNTGTFHFVRFVHGLDSLDIIPQAKEIRYASKYAPAGTNVNFAEPCGDVLKVRTYEKGVEAETFACGTGIVASCIAAYYSGVAGCGRPHDACDVSLDGHGRQDGIGDNDGKRVHYRVKALKDMLSVDFVPGTVLSDGGRLAAADAVLRSMPFGNGLLATGNPVASDVYLTGPAVFVAKVEVPDTLG